MRVCRGGEGRGNSKVLALGRPYDSEGQEDSRANRLLGTLDERDAECDGTGEGRRRRSSPDARNRTASSFYPTAPGVECRAEPRTRARGRDDPAGGGRT